MGNVLFDYACGRWVDKFDLPVGGDNIMLVLLKAAGLQADGTLMTYKFLSDLLAASNDECDATNYARKAYSDADITIVTNTGTHITTVDMTDPNWLGLGGVVNNDLGALVTCYRKTSADTIDQWLLLTKQDWVRTTSGMNHQITVPTMGSAKWSAT